MNVDAPVTSPLGSHGAPALTARQEQLLYLLAEEGLSCKEIAYRMGNVTESVRVNLTKLAHKLGLPASGACCQNVLHLTIWYWRRRESQLRAN